MIFNIEPFLRRLDFQVLTEEKKDCQHQFQRREDSCRCESEFTETIDMLPSARKKSKLAFSKEKNYKKGPHRYNE